MQAVILKTREHLPGRRNNVKIEAMLQIPEWDIPVWMFVPETVLQECTAKRLRGESCRLRGSRIEVNGKVRLKNSGRHGFIERCYDAQVDALAS